MNSEDGAFSFNLPIHFRNKQSIELEESILKIYLRDLEPLHMVHLPTDLVRITSISNILINKRAGAVIGPFYK